jgi:protein TonB
MFASSWSAPQRRSPKRLWILTSSIVLHGLVFAFLAAIEVWHVEAVAEPPANDVFQVQLPPPPIRAVAATPPASAPPKAAAQKEAVLKPPAPTPPAPSVVPQADPLKAAESLIPPAAAPSSPWPPDLPANGDNGGGDRNGKGTSGGHGIDGSGDDDGPLPVGGAVERPQILRRVQPLYTERARRIHLQGTVILQATIDEQGNVIDVQVVKGMPMGLDDEAVKAVRQWRFTPGMLRGRPVKVYFNLTVIFQVN